MPKKPQNDITSNERGQALVEFAMVLPLLAVLLFGVIQFGIVYNHYVTLTDATRAGARKAVVSRYYGASGANSACVNAVKASATDLDQSKLQITCTSSWQPATDVEVKAKYPYSINLLGIVVAGGDLTSVTTERVE